MEWKDTITNHRLLLIVNPRSGARRGARVLDQVLPALSQAGRSVDVCQTVRAGDATEIARSRSLEEVGAVCLIGGDGTLHEVLNGLLTREDSLRPPLGIIPCGTGNTVAADLGIHDPFQAVKCIVAGHTRPIDLLRVEMESGTAYCCNIVGWGAVTQISTDFLKLNRR